VKIQGYDIQEGLLYTKEHEWARFEDQVVRIGVTDYAAKTLNDVVYVAAPKLHENVAQFKLMGTIESIKAVSELYSPISGTVTKVNQQLDSHPELVNKSPYDEGWLVEVLATNLTSEKKQLLDSASYSAFLSELLKK
jgi:glycine cleavage system H protein